MTPSSVPKKSWSWRSQAFRGLVYQVVAFSVIALGLWWLASNTLHNMQVRGIQSGFDFLLGPAGFDIGARPWPPTARSPRVKIALRTARSAPPIQTGTRWRLRF